jgi:hypothetical protein
MSETARKGKIARLPRKVRDELNQRLDDGQPGSQVLPWLNAMPEVQAVLDRHFGGASINDQNLSDWRLGGFRDWQKANEEAGTVKQLTEYAAALVAGGRDPHDAANVIAGGRLLAALEENLTTDLIKEIVAEKPADMIGLIGSLVSLQKERRQAVETRLDVTKFQRETGEMFLKFYDDRRAKEIAESKDAQPVKLDKMVQLMFGVKPGVSP